MGKLRTLVLAVVSLTCGCIGSVQPVIEEGNATFDPALLGTWADSASAERAVITADGPRRYAIRYTDDAGQTMLLTGVLGRIDARRVLDVQATSKDLGAYKDVVVRMHFPLVLDAPGPRLHVATLETDSLGRFLERNPRAVAHVGTEGALLLTADTPTLVRFLERYLRRPGSVAAPTTWIRTSTEPSR
jgi:hypothetical protein